MKLTPRFGSSKEFEEWTGGWYNIGKLVGLVALAFWTLFQWNVSIFPKESHESLIRRAAARTDITVEVEDMKAEQVDEEEDLRTLALSAGLSLKNDKDFPIAVRSPHIMLRYGRLDFSKSKLADSVKVFVLLPYDWEDLDSISVNRVLGLFEDTSSLVIEPGGTVAWPLYHLVQVWWGGDQNVVLLGLTVDFTAEAIDPETGQVLPGSRKRKTAAFRATLTEDDKGDVTAGGGGGKFSTMRTKY